jgi:hypothetical protein
VSNDRAARVQRRQVAAAARREEQRLAGGDLLVVVVGAAVVGAEEEEEVVAEVKEVGTPVVGTPVVGAAVVGAAVVGEDVVGAEEEEDVVEAGAAVAVLAADLVADALNADADAQRALDIAGAAVAGAALAGAALAGATLAGATVGGPVVGGPVVAGAAVAGAAVAGAAVAGAAVAGAAKGRRGVWEAVCGVWEMVWWIVSASATWMAAWVAPIVATIKDTIKDMIEDMDMNVSKTAPFLVTLFILWAFGWGWSGLVTVLAAHSVFYDRRVIIAVLLFISVITVDGILNDAVFAVVDAVYEVLYQVVDGGWWVEKGAKGGGVSWGHGRALLDAISTDGGFPVGLLIFYLSMRVLRHVGVLPGIRRAFANCVAANAGSIKDNVVASLNVVQIVVQTGTVSVVQLLKEVFETFVTAAEGMWAADNAAAAADDNTVAW